MKFNYFLVLALLFLLVFTACQTKEEDPSPDVKTLLANRTWRMTAYTAQAANGDAVDLYAALRSCDRDDTWRFADNNYYEKDENVVKCDTLASAIYETGAWNVLDKTLHLNPSGTSPDKTYTVQEVTPTTLRLQNEKITQQATVTFELTFTSQ